MFAIGWAIGLGCVGVAGGMMANYFFIFTDVGINFALFANRAKFIPTSVKIKK